MNISMTHIKAFNKNQHPFLIKTLSNLGIERNFPIPWYCIYEKPIANKYLYKGIYKMVKDQIVFSKDKDIHFHQFFCTLYWQMVQWNKKEKWKAYRLELAQCSGLRIWHCSSCGIGCSCGSDQLLARELSYISGSHLKKKKKKTKRSMELNRLVSRPTHIR